MVIVWGASEAPSLEQQVNGKFLVPGAGLFVYYCEFWEEYRPLAPRVGSSNYTLSYIICIIGHLCFFQIPLVCVPPFPRPTFPSPSLLPFLRIIPFPLHITHVLLPLRSPWPLSSYWCLPALRVKHINMKIQSWDPHIR